MPHTLLSVDPGKSDCGVAFFVSGVLTDAAFLAPPNASPYEVAREVAIWGRRCMMNMGDPEGRVSQLIVEGQQIYPMTTLAQSQQLLFLAQTIGGVLARVDCFERKIILPKTWTKGVPKPIRQRRFLSAASDYERSLIMSILPASKRHNTIDAICMGAYELGRLRVGEPDQEIQ